jgi:hypothetical protein
VHELPWKQKTRKEESTPTEENEYSYNLTKKVHRKTKKRVLPLDGNRATRQGSGLHQPDLMKFEEM